MWNTPKPKSSSANFSWKAPAAQQQEQAPSWKAPEPTFTIKSGVLQFDHAQHSGDGGGHAIDERSNGDESANVYRELTDLGYEVQLTSQTEAETLAPLLEDVAMFVLPEAEGGNLFPDAPTVFNFVNQGGNLLFFGGNGVGGEQLDYINATFDMELTGSYNAYGFYPLSLDAPSEFAEGPSALGENNGTSYINISSLPDDAIMIYGRNDETILAFMPQGDGNIVFLGWDYYNAPSQDNGWDAAFEIVAESHYTIYTTQTDDIIWNTPDVKLVGVPEFKAPVTDDLLE